MDKRSVALVVVVLAAAAVFFALSGKRQQMVVSEQVAPQPIQEPSATWDSNTQAPEIVLAPPVASNVVASNASVKTTTTPIPTPVKVGFAINPIENPRGAIDEVLTNEMVSDDEKWQRLYQLLPTVPEAFQEETAQHLCNLIPDSAYGVLGPLLTNGIAPEPVLDVVMSDLLSRPNNLKLPMLLNMARNEQHQRNDEARSVLELYLENDYGTDWRAWEQSLLAYLRDNPD